MADYDAYYYNKKRTKPLPVLRVQLDDPQNTSYYINPKTTQVLMKYQKLSYLNRWLYHGLHSLDFPGLFFKRPLWDIVVIFLMLGGTAASFTGLVLTWNWLKRKSNKNLKEGRNTKTATNTNIAYKSKKKTYYLVSKKED